MISLTLEDRNELINLLKGNSLLASRRGREAIFINADLQKLLPMVDLEGEPFIVVTHVVHFLEKYGRVSYEQEALGRFLNVIKQNSTGIHEQEFIDHLLRDYRMMVPAITLPDIIKWQGQFNEEDVFEAVIGENTLRHIAFLQQGLQASNAVVCVKVGTSHQGTGYMVTPDLLLTNHHVLSDKSLLSETIFQFNYQLDTHGNAESIEEFTSKNKGLYHSSKNLDYTFVEIAKQPGNKWGFLPLSTQPVTINQRVNIIQHPAGLPKQISIQNNFVEYVDTRVAQYLTSTMKGSSGSPVLNDEWKVIALHHAGGMLLEPATKRRYFRNEGILISAILNDLPSGIQKLLK